MTVNQIYSIINSVTTEVLGGSAIVNEDLSNIIDVGQSFENAAGGLDNFVRALNDHVGRMVFVDRIYKGRTPSVLMDGWEFGAILEKVACEIPEANENESWDLNNGSSYDPNIFYKPTVYVNAYNKRVTFEIDMSFTEKQVKSAFTNATQMNSFISMLYTAIANSMTIKLDALVMRAINNMIADTIHDDYAGGSLSAGSYNKAVNLLYLYNTNANTGDPITTSEAMTDPEFMRFASLVIRNYVSRMQTPSNLFNIGGKTRFTPNDLMHIVMLSEFKNGVNTYLQSDTFNDEYTALPNSEDIPYWQGSGTDYAFSSTSAINVTSANNNTVTTTGILAVIFDRDALGVANIDRRVTSVYNPKGEFFNEFHKFDAGYFNDENENFVVFFVA